MYGFILHCDGCLADIQLGAKDLERVDDHTYASSPRYATEDEAYWAGVAKAMERTIGEKHDFEATVIQTYRYERGEGLR
jgi:hypothetical protein